MADSVNRPTNTLLTTLTVVTITELDAWYTAIITVAKYNIFECACSKDVTIAFWTAFGLVMLGFGVYLALTCAITFKGLGVCLVLTCAIIFKLNYCISSASILCLWIISALYILGNNKHLLDCYNSQSNMNKVHLIVLCVFP